MSPLDQVGHSDVRPFLIGGSYTGLGPFLRISSWKTPLQENIRDNVRAPAETEDVDEEVDSKG